MVRLGHRPKTTTRTSIYTDTNSTTLPAEKKDRAHRVEVHSASHHLVCSQSRLVMVQMGALTQLVAILT